MAVILGCLGGMDTAPAQLRRSEKMLAESWSLGGGQQRSISIGISGGENEARALRVRDTEAPALCAWRSQWPSTMCPSPMWPLQQQTDGLGRGRRHHPGHNLVTLRWVFPFLKDEVLLSQMDPSGAFQAAGLGKRNFLFFFYLFTHRTLSIFT